MVDALTGKVAIATGAGRGIGRVVAMALAAEGAPKSWSTTLAGAVDGTGASHSLADDVVAEIRAAGDEAVATSVPSAAERVHNHVLIHLGPVRKPRPVQLWRRQGRNRGIHPRRRHGYGTLRRAGQRDFFRRELAHDDVGHCPPDSRRFRHTERFGSANPRTTLRA